MNASGATCGSIACSSLPVTYLDVTAVCSATCGSGLQARTTLMLGPLGSLLATNATTAACATDACPAFFWQLEDWSPCSAACGSGQQTRQATCINGSSGAPSINTTRCGPPPPAPLTRTCNSAPCSFAVWLVGTWSTCEDGATTRVVQCVTSTGLETGSSQCRAPAPLAAAACNVSAPTDSLPACVSGLSDASGTCCPIGSALDAAGACCSSGDVDTCGVCGGAGRAVDVTGACCLSLLDAAGLCCASGRLDALGVCDGDGTSGNLALGLRFAAPSGTGAQWAAAADRALAPLLGTSIYNLRAVAGAASPPADGSAGVTFPLSVSVTPTASLQLGLVVARLQDVMSGASSFSTAFPSLRLLALDSAATQPVCGNGVCEV